MNIKQQSLVKFTDRYKSGNEPPSAFAENIYNFIVPQVTMSLLIFLRHHNATGYFRLTKEVLFVLININVCLFVSPLCVVCQHFRKVDFLEISDNYSGIRINIRKIRIQNNTLDMK